MGLTHAMCLQDKQQQGRKRKLPKASTRQRLAKKLLGNKGISAAFVEMSGVEGDVAREREQHRWEER